MITITLNEESGITVGELSVFPSKDKITGFVNVKTDGNSWYFSSIWKYGISEDFENGKTLKFDNLPIGLDVNILKETGEEKYPTTDGGYTDYKKDIYRACDRWRQVLEEKYPSLVGQISITGI